MLWAVHCLDRPDAAARRSAARAAHSARLTAVGTDVRPVMYGRLVGGDESTAVGSLIVVEAESRDQVERFVAEDPFVQAGVWREVRIDGFEPSTRSPVSLSGAPRTADGGAA